MICYDFMHLANIKTKQEWKDVLQFTTHALSNAFFGILHISMVIMFIYCRHTVKPK
jgi:hypothetical protein